MAAFLYACECIPLPFQRADIYPALRIGRVDVAFMLYCIWLSSFHATAKVESSREESRQACIKQQDGERKYQGEGGKWPVMHLTLRGHKLIDTHRGGQFIRRLQ